MKLSEILPHLQPTYKSIELDIACTLYGGKWFNILTIVKFTYENYEIANQRISKEDVFVKLSNNQRFRMYKKNLPLSSLEKILENFHKGVKIIDGTEIEYGYEVNLENFDLHFYDYSPISSDNVWSAFHTYHTDNSANRQTLNKTFDSLKSEVIICGEDVYDAIQNMFHVDIRGESNKDIILVMPFFAKIEEMEPQGRKITFTARYHKNLKDLVLQYRKEDGGNPKIATYEQPSNIKDENDDFKIWSINVDDLTGQTDNVRCSAFLFYKPLNIGTRSVGKSISQISAEQKLLDSNPFAKIFDRFCKIEKFEQLLTNPTDVKMSNFVLGSAYNFERMVQWLFTLHGFRAIWLGQDFQTIKDEQNRDDGSADLICYNEEKKTLAVVSCKTGSIGDDAINLVKNLAEKFIKDFEGSQITVLPILVSSKQYHLKKEKETKHTIRIIDVDDLKTIVAKLYEGPPQPDLLLKISGVTDTTTFQNFGIHL